MNALNKHSWPGNVRELQNVIERAVILCSDGGVLEPAYLGLAAKADLASIVSTAVTSTGAKHAPVYVLPVDEPGEGCSLSEVEKRHIIAALERAKGNRTHAAKILDISIRTLRNKLNEYHYEDPVVPAKKQHAH